MKKLLSSLSVGLLSVSTLLPIVALARQYDDDSLPYSDAPFDRATRVAVSVLTDEGVIQGDPGGTVRPYDTLNRAEFTTMVLRLPHLNPSLSSRRCFVDVNAGDWFSPYVCYAKDIGLVSGNAYSNLSPEQWPFEPARSVRYEEALKVVIESYDLPLSSYSGAWYEPYIRKAGELGLLLPGRRPGDVLTRGEVARLIAGFFAYDEGELDALRRAERGEDVDTRDSSHSSSRTSRSSSSSSLSSSSRTSSSSSSYQNAVYDPLPVSTVQSKVVILGETSAPIAAADFFVDQEPLLAETLTINLSADIQSIASIIVYDEETRYIGRALRIASGKYELSIPEGALYLPRREDVRLYVRADLKQDDSGGVSGQQFRVANLTMQGYGDWSNTTYTRISSDTFPFFETGHANIVDVYNDGGNQRVFVSGTERQIGSFSFATVQDDTTFDPAIRSIEFDMSKATGVNVSNVELRREGYNDAHACSVNGNTITCSSLPSDIGWLSSGDPVPFEVYADISVDSGITEPFLQLSINDSGTPTTIGAVSWDDGESIFEWVGLPSPLALGTVYR